METILVVEDEPGIARLVHDYLVRAGFAVVRASSAGEALAGARSSAPALVVLDLGLPDRDGLDVLRDLRDSIDVPIVILTARGDETDGSSGSNSAQTTMWSSHSAPKELVARVRAVLSRTERRGRLTSRSIRARGLVLDVPRMRVSEAERSIELTPTEFQLVLETLSREPGRVFTRNQLLDAVHGVAFESYERAIDAHIKNIRRKLELAPGDPAIHPDGVRVGYRFADA